VTHIYIYILVTGKMAMKVLQSLRVEDDEGKREASNGATCKSSWHSIANYEDSVLPT